MRTSVRLRWALLTVAVVCGIAVVRIVAIDFGDTDFAPERDPMRPRVVMHVHTKHSADGHGTTADVVRAARNTATDVVWLTDHETRQGQDRIDSGVLLLHGVEHTTSRGHLLMLGGERLLTRKERRGPNPVAAARRVRGFTIAAHTDRETHGRWTGNIETDALEIYNFGTDGLRALRFPFLSLTWAALAYPIGWRYALSTLINFPHELASHWERTLAADRRTIGLCSVDAHGRLIPSYEVLFAAIANYVVLESPLTGDPRVDHDRLLAAIRAGRVICAFEVFGRARRVRIGATSAAGKHHVGDEVPLPATLTVESGQAWNTQGEILRDGRPVHKFWNRASFEVTEPGTYRVVLSRFVPTFGGTRWAPWVFANPMFFRHAPTSKEAQ